MNFQTYQKSFYTILRQKNPFYLCKWIKHNFEEYISLYVFKASKTNPRNQLRPACLKNKYCWRGRSFRKKVQFRKYRSNFGVFAWKRFPSPLDFRKDGKPKQLSKRQPSGHQPTGLWSPWRPLTRPSAPGTASKPTPISRASKWCRWKRFWPF